MSEAIVNQNFTIPIQKDLRRPARVGQWQPLTGTVLTAPIPRTASSPLFRCTRDPQPSTTPTDYVLVASLSQPTARYVV